MVNLDSVPVTELHRHLGAHPLDGGGTQFCVWSPVTRGADRTVHVYFPELGRSVPMRRIEGDYHIAEVADVGPGDRYMIQVGDDEPRPDPVSRFQPDGVHGPSQVVSRQFAWNDDDWKGVDREDLVIYELHLGAFTDAGTLDAAAQRLDELVDLGVTAVELMPLADAAGRWNWGYDGVHLFAPNRNYGPPEALRRFVDTAHAKGLAVILDVVYNHFGPEGNYLGHIAPYFSERHSTVWGAAPNVDDARHGRPVRNYFIANVLYWLEEYHIDALRVDAIHCMMDDSPTHLVEEMSRAVKQWSATTGRAAMMIAESNIYDPRMIRSLEHGGYGFDAEWCDDFLHSVFAVLRPGEHLSDRVYEPGKDLQQVVQYGFVFEGAIHRPRIRRHLSHRVDTHGLVYSIQTHDFIGNHPLGKRLHQLTSLDSQRAAAALMLLLPAIPMLFMGEEFACEHPFQFFVDFGDHDLRRGVVEGRRLEYPQHDWSNGVMPIDPHAFESSRIGRAEDGNEDMRHWYKALIEQRKAWRREGLLCDDALSVQTDAATGLFQLSYRSDDVVATVAVRLAADGSTGDAINIEAPGELILDSHPGPTPRHQLNANHAKVFAQRG